MRAEARRTLLVILLAGWSAPASAQGPENVAVVLNEASPASRQVTEYYVRKRGIPSANVITLRTVTDDVIERGAYAATIEAPIAAALARQGLQDRILYLVLTKGIPLRIAGTEGNEGTTASVDSN